MLLLLSSLALWTMEHGVGVRIPSSSSSGAHPRNLCYHSLATTYEGDHSSFYDGSDTIDLRWLFQYKAQTLVSIFTCRDPQTNHETPHKS
jgi:hypothetical protein